MQARALRTVSQDDAFYEDMGAAMNELSVVLLNMGYGPVDVRAFSNRLSQASGLKPAADKDKNMGGS